VSIQYRLPRKKVKHIGNGRQPVSNAYAGIALQEGPQAGKDITNMAGDFIGGSRPSLGHHDVTVGEITPFNHSPVGGYLKRAIDIAIASTALVLLSPIMAMVALAIRITEDGPVTFSQKRLGYNGVEFDCYKFRTMVTNAEERLSQLLEEDPEVAKEWRETQKLVDDPRITTFGHLLRKSSLDELPQLVNILRGEMSCVGPRPITTKEIERYGKSARYYLRARPGLTGLWQVSGRSRLSYERRVELDSDYVRNQSLYGDLKIMLKTIPALLSFEQTS
jgi:exopolysaccharide production protein ExoY